MLFQGKQKCEHCGCDYKWWGEFVNSGESCVYKFQSEVQATNIYELGDNLYSIEVICPKCNKREHFYYVDESK